MEENVTVSTENLGIEELYNVSNVEEGILTFFNLGTVHIDYTEMKRQSTQLVTKGLKAIAQLELLVNSVSNLASLVGCSIDISSLETLINEVKEDCNYINSEITSQIDLYVKQTKLTNDELKQLNKLVREVISSDGKITYTDLNNNTQTISYNNLLKDYYRAELMSGYGVADLEYLLEVCKAGNKSVSDVYTYIEENLSSEIKNCGLTTGEEYLNYLLDYASKDALTNRDKAVTKALALCKFLGENGISGKYKLGGGHIGDAQYTLTSALSGGVDCSAFASTLARLGNPNFNAGATGTLIQGTTSIDVNNILPGDIIVSTYSGYEHARFVLGVDTVNNRLITVEAGGYSGSGGYDTNYDYFDNIHVDSFDIDTLIRQGYKANHVDYDSSGQTTL